MFFKKNLPTSERVLRVCAGLGMLGAAAALEMPQWAVWLLALSGATSVLTALVGFCPACAMAGRRTG